MCVVCFLLYLQITGLQLALMKCPKISTITSCYKAERFLPIFLEQLPRQTMFDSLQVVIDHSNPSAQEVKLIEDFANKYPGKIKHIIRDSVVPIYTAWNNCVREADGDFVAIWNIDDLRTPDSLEQQYVALLNSNAGLAFGNYYVVRTFGACDGDFVSRAGIPHSDQTRTMSAGPFFMFRKSLCDTVGYFDEQMKSSADFDFCVRLAFHTTFLHVPVTLGYYLNEGLGTSTRADSLQPVEDTVIALRYGMYDNVEYSLLPRVSTYVIPRILQLGQWAHVRDYVPNWEELLHNRGQLWLEDGIRKNFYALRRNARARYIRQFARKWLGETLYAKVKKIRGMWSSL